MLVTTRVFSWPLLVGVAILLVSPLLVPLLAAPADAATIYVEGPCTLTKAIIAANTDISDGDCIAGFGADTIELTGDVTLTVVDNTHTGANGLPLITTDVTIDGNDWAIERAGGPTSFRILKVQSGASLTLRHVSIRNGRVSTGVGQTYGGAGVLNLGTLTLIDSTVSGNDVLGEGWWAAGGGIFNSGILVVTASTISLNSAVSTTSGASGGGVRSTVVASTTITNSTISGNYVVSTVATGHGGGLALDGQALLRNSTLSGNAASTGGAAMLAKDGTTVQGSIIANSLLSANCGGTPELTDGGGNQADDDSCATIPDTLSELDPVLRDNGGPTMTHALLAGNSAVHAAGACGLIKDQRGAPRGVLCDAGAFEYGGCPEIVLDHDTVLGPEHYESCHIYAGPNYVVVGPFGALTLVGGRDVELADGFTVGLDAALTVEIDPSLIP